MISGDPIQMQFITQDELSNTQMFSKDSLVHLEDWQLNDHGTISLIPWSSQFVQGRFND